ncbi:MAG: substrate-binding domain-containing protein [Butyribacter sp.]|nr:substrate-binding domain-containing protein [bacterium]MDY3854918.1 substrate-binding domain-containing protein [Butyribacter sp.]
MRLKKLAALGLSVVCATGLLAGCGSSGNDSSEKSSDAAKQITVVTREDGSGTRGAFIELFGIEEEDENGEKVDKTTTDAAVANSTETMMTTVAGDEYAIGYTSLGALNDTVKALKVDGVEATAENVKSGDYKIQRPFNIATKGEVSDVAQDFINYILSPDGQAVVEEKGYIQIDDQKDFESNNATGKIVVAGSSSVTPVMEKLAEAYQKVNTGAEIEVQESDSTTGMTATADGTCDIGMASRELKDSETSAGLESQVIAIDGIAVIVNTENEAEDISADLVKKIFTGETTDWKDVK